MFELPGPIRNLLSRYVFTRKYFKLEICYVRKHFLIRSAGHGRVAFQKCGAIAKLE